MRRYKTHTITKYFLADIRRILLTLDEENRGSNLHPYVKYACDRTRSYETHNR